MFNIKLKTKSGRTLLSIGKEPPARTEEEMIELRRQAMEHVQKCYEALHSGVLSSKKGREIYYGRIGVLGLPGELLVNAFEFLSGKRAWYSEEGSRITY